MTSKVSENLNSNTFFHFRRTLENLTGILSKTFEPRYCLEKTYWSLWKLWNWIKEELGILKES